MCDPEFLLVELNRLSAIAIGPMVAESRQQGQLFVDRLVADYESGANRFDKAGEALYGVYNEGRLIAVGGLNRDPYLPDQAVGRLRHLYVLEDWRRQGVGRLLVDQIIAAARQHFRILTLRTVDDGAARFYEALGFVTDPSIQGASHHMLLTNR